MSGLMRILFITSNRVGDAILSSGILRALYEDYPDAAYTIVAGPVALGVFEGFPGDKHLIPMRKTKSRGLHWIKLWREVMTLPFSAKAWDIIVDLRDSIIGFTVPRKRLLRPPRHLKDSHRVAHAGAALNREADPPAPKVWTNAEQRDKAAAHFAHLAADHGPILCIGPTANWQGKIWPIENFVALAKRLTAEDAVFGKGVLAVIGGPDEREQAAPLLDILPPERTVDLIGTPLGEAAASIEQSDLYIGNDSGLMHMAAAVETPTLGLFGPSRDWLYYPWGEHCDHVRTPESFQELISAPDYDRHKTGSLMRSLSVDKVEAVALALWKSSRDGGTD